MTLLGWLAIYSVVLVPLSIAGGRVLLRAQLSHTRMQHLMSGVAGLMLGIAVLHMLPHALESTGRLSPHGAGAAMLAGMLAMFLLLRTLHFHHHEAPEVAACTHAHDHDRHDHTRPDHAAGPPGQFTWLGMLVGMAIHTLVDGVALGAAMQADETGRLPGLGVMLAITLHQPLDAMSVIGKMIDDGWSRGAQLAVNIGLALLCPAGAALLLSGLASQSDLGIAVALAASAGVFLCIALSDLLPEMEFHDHDRLTLSLALLAGVAVAAGLMLLHGGHSHG